MKFSESLKKNADFQKVYRNGKSYANKHFVMYVIKNNSTKNRVGISVSKKVGNSIVRHHITRLVREGYRLHEEGMDCGYDMIFVARVAAKDQSFEVIKNSILHVASLHHIYHAQSKKVKNADEKSFTENNQIL